jgi:hypothetical protein
MTRIIVILATLAHMVGCVGDVSRIRANRAAGPPSVALQAAYVMTVGTRGTDAGLFTDPTGLSTNALGQVFVADTGNDRIQMFQSNGDYLTEIGGFGWDVQQFNAPTGIGSSASLDVWVADTRNRRIVHLDSRLNWLGTITTTDDGAESVDLGFPADVVESDDGWLWFSDRDNDRVRRISPFPSDGDIAISRMGVSDLSDPGGIAIGPQGHVYVADTGNDRIVVYSEFGTLLQILGQEFLKGPRGIAVTVHGDVVIADTDNHRIVFLNRLGNVVGELGLYGERPGEFRTPMDVTVDLRGFLWVADTGNHRLQKFSLTRITD